MTHEERDPIRSAQLVEEELEQARRLGLPEHEIDKDGSVGGGIASAAGSAGKPTEGLNESIEGASTTTGSPHHGLYTKMDEDPRKTPATPPETD